MNTKNAKNAKKTKAKNQEEPKNIELTFWAVKNVRVVNGSKGDIVFLTLNLNGVEIYNVRVGTGKNGDFISFPQIKGKDDKYYNTAYARLSNEDQKAILETIQDEIDRQ